MVLQKQLEQIDQFQDDNVEEEHEADAFPPPPK